jgi:hypothetical protein
MIQVLTSESVSGVSGNYVYSGLSYSTEYEWQLIIHNSERATIIGDTWGFTAIFDPSIILIGTGSTTDVSLPIEPYYGYSYSQTIYSAADFGSVGCCKRIEKIWYNYSWSTSGDDDSDDWVVYMNTTTETNLDAGWLPIAGFTEVFNGDVDLQLVTGSSWLEITLDTPFLYEPCMGENLIIAVDENTPSYCGSSDEFLCDINQQENVSRVYYNDSTNLDPYSPSQAGTASTYYPNTRFKFGDMPCGSAALGVSPDSDDFGIIQTGECSDSELFTVSNVGWGGCHLGIATIAVNGTDSDQFTILNNPAPCIIDNYDSLDIEVQFCPTSTGVKTAFLTFYDCEEYTDIPLFGTGVELIYPQNVIINITGTDVQISWDAVTGATSYSVFSSDNPYLGLEEDFSGTFVDESWNAPLTDVKKFYYVKAYN